MLKVGINRVTNEGKISSSKMIEIGRPIPETFYTNRPANGKFKGSAKFWGLKLENPYKFAILAYCCSLHMQNFRPIRQSCMMQLENRKFFY